MGRRCICPLWSMFVENYGDNKFQFESQSRPRGAPRYAAPAVIFLHGIFTQWFDLNSDVIILFEGSNKTCTEVSNSLYRKAEDVSGFCDAARTEYFSSCCFDKCDLCQGAQLDANVEVAYNASLLGTRTVGQRGAHGEDRKQSDPVLRGYAQRECSVLHQTHDHEELSS